MAIGDIKWFAQALTNLGNKQFDLTNDVLKLGIVTGATAPAIDTANPHWGGTGTVNFAATQVALGTAYTGPITLTGKSWVHTPAGPVLRADIIDIAQDAGGFTNGAYGILYDHTDVNKRALGWIDLTGLSLVTSSAKVDWNGASNDILTLDA